MTLIHGLGVVGVTKLLRLEDRRLRAHSLNIGAFGLLTSIALCLFAVHFVEIALFALFYLQVDALRNVEEALFFSASAYATLGHPEIQFPEQWRLVGAIEGLVGFLLIGWSTAVFIADMNKVLREDID
ncbi:MAG TPA: ion channel [Rhizorhapis sp.]|nr:ion channel [Rhizorhapis sp.]